MGMKEIQVLCGSCMGGHHPFKTFCRSTMLISYNQRGFAARHPAKTA